MTPKKKAEELFEKMLGIGDEHHHCTTYVAKQCALIAVDEIIEFEKKIVDKLNIITKNAKGQFKIELLYWEKVKKQIKKI